jgi:anthranilate synthase/indole-3-glycerol phosphate synthase/phosphoribosylanthranilate isomerase
LGIRGYHAIPLLDSGAGGSGTQLDLNDIKQALKRDPSLRIMLAGGLNSNNVRSVLGELGEYSDQVVGVDVSSGVEVNGEQSIPMIREFASAVNSY